MASENQSGIMNTSDIADILYNAFVRALETNDVKFNQRGKLEEVLKKEISNLGKINQKEEAKIREAIQNGFKKGASVQGELQKYFRDLTTAITNNEKNRIQGLSKGSVMSAHPKTEKIFQERENKIRRSSLSKYNRLNEKLNKSMDKVDVSNTVLSENASRLSKSSRKLDYLTNSIVGKTDSIENNLSWLESASSNISSSNKKTSKITNSLIKQSIKIDKESSWAESSLDNLKGSSKRLGKFFKRGGALEPSESGNEVEKNQGENSFIGKLVKKLEGSKLGGAKSDLLRFAATAIASKVYGATHNSKLAGLAYFGSMGAAGHELMTGFRGTRAVGRTLGGAALRTHTGQKGASGLMNMLLKTKSGLPLAEGLASAGAVKVGGGLLGKLIPGLGASLFGVDAASRFKKGDKLGGAISSMGAFGSAMSLSGAGAIIGEPMALIAALLNLSLDYIKPISKAVSALFKLFVKEKPPKKKGAPAGGWDALSQTSLDTTSMSRDKLLSSIGGNSYFEKLTGGSGYSIANGQMTHDIPYGRAGTNSAYNKAFAGIFAQSKYAGLKGRVQMTGALGTKASLGIHKTGSASHYTGTKQDWQVFKGGKYDPEGTRLLEEAFISTGLFSRVSPEATHSDVQVSKSAYEKYNNSVKQQEQKKQGKISPSGPAAPSISQGSKTDLSGNDLISKIMMPTNYIGIA